MRGIILPLVAAVALATAPAMAHDWYPLKCCSEQDCQPIAQSDVKMTPRGWEVAATGEVIPFGDRREHVSPDGEFHRCSRANVDSNLEDRTICLFVPGMSS
jgi:hypothetical protein